MGRAPLSAWHLMLQLDHGAVGVYCYDDEERKVEQNSAVQWHVIFLLACYNRKHIFVGKSLPKFEVVNDAFKEFANRLRWRHFLQGSATVPVDVRLSRRTTAEFVGAREPHLEYCLRSVHAALHLEFKKGGAMP